MDIDPNEDPDLIDDEGCGEEGCVDCNPDIDDGDYSCKGELPDLPSDEVDETNYDPYAGQDTPFGEELDGGYDDGF